MVQLSWIVVFLELFVELNGIHLINYDTRYCVGVRITSQESFDIKSTIFKHWIAYIGTPGFIITDNSKEFDNQSFWDMVLNLNIVVTTTAESPWSDRLNEWHNEILGEMVKKPIEDTYCNFEIALAWVIIAKNTLQNVYGYSPNQLVFGRNPK